MTHRIFHSKLFLSLVITATALSIAALTREVTGTIKVKKEIKRLEQQAAELSEKNKKLKDLVDFLQSTEYQEKQARDQLNLQLPGETAVALPTENPVSSNEQDATLKPNNLALWWNYFFGLR